MLQISEKENQILERLISKTDPSLLEKYCTQFQYGDKTGAMLYSGLLSSFHLKSLEDGLVFNGETNLIQELNNIMEDELDTFSLIDFDYR